MSDKLRIKCPSCKKSLVLPSAALGRKLKCPGCDATFRTKAPAPPAPPAEPEELEEPEEFDEPDEPDEPDEFDEFDEFDEPEEFDEFGELDDYGETEDDFGDEPVPVRRKTSIPGSRQKSAAGPRSTLQDLMAEGPPIWIKIAGGAIATPFAIAWGMARARRGNATVFPQSAPALIFGLIASLIVGACLGAALSLKDVVENRLATGQPVALPLKLLFGLGLRSLLIWIPLIMFLSLAWAIFV